MGIMDESVSKKVVQGQETLQRLVQTATEIFIEKGYAATGTEEIVKRAGVTRGALYHHFKGKRELFVAAFETANQQMAQGLEEMFESEPTTWAKLEVGCQTYLATLTSPELSRICAESVSVLGVHHWLEVGERHYHGILRGLLEQLIEAGEIESQPVATLGHIISGALNELALWAINAPDVEHSKQEAHDALMRLLTMLKAKN